MNYFYFGSSIEFIREGVIILIPLPTFEASSDNLWANPIY